MYIHVRCLDFNSGDPVPGVALTCTIKVAPRVLVLGAQHDDPPPGPPTSLKSKAAAGTPGAKRLKILEDEAVTMALSPRVAGPDGEARFEVDVEPEYQRQSAAHPPGSNEEFFDMAVYFRLGGSIHGLKGESQSINTASVKGPTRSVTVERVVVVDGAKSIVGHTTRETCRLWFQLHGEQLRDALYECIVQPTAGGESGAQVLPVSFSEEHARTQTLTVEGLTPGTAYRYWLRMRRGDVEWILSQGSFRTAAADERALTVLFGSCFKPIDEEGNDPERDLQHWKRLAGRSDGDLQLFLGDQVYCDEVPEPPDRNWLPGYIERYNQFWAYHPVRQALSRRPTYMITDDHEVKDDWGMDDRIPPERITAGEDAFRIFQLAHSPSGRDGPFHYHFRRGPAAFFMMDSRSKRGTDGEFPSFGKEQWRDFVAWAKSSDEVRDADIIVFGSPVPVALLPIDELRVMANNLAVVVGALVGAFAGSPHVLTPNAIGAWLGAVGAEIAYEKVEKTKLADVDYREAWTHGPNQSELSPLLNVLFALANGLDLDPEHPDPTFRRTRAVFILGGDCHFGLMHVITSNSRSAPDHGTNPLLMHLTSSAIGRPPQDNEYLRFLFRDIADTPQDLPSIVEKLAGDFPEKATQFVLDIGGDKRYCAAALGALFECNVGRLRIERVGSGRRYRVQAVIEGEAHDLSKVVEVDLDARPVVWRGYDTDLRLSQSLLAFGSVPLGATATRILTIRNFTGRDVEIATSSPVDQFSWTPFQGVIAHSSERRIEVQYTGSPFISRADLRITCDTPGSPYQVLLLGKGPGGIPPDPGFPPNLIYAPQVLTFAGLQNGETDTRTFTIENVTGRKVEVSVSKPPPTGQFSSSGFEGILQPGDKQSIEVHYTASPSIARAVLTITSNTPASPQEVALVGKGPGGFPPPDTEPR